MAANIIGFPGRDQQSRGAFGVNSFQQFMNLAPVDAGAQAPTAAALLAGAGSEFGGGAFNDFFNASQPSTRPAPGSVQKTTFNPSPATTGLSEEQQRLRDASTSRTRHIGGGEDPATADDPMKAWLAGQTTAKTEVAGDEAGPDAMRKWLQDQSDIQQTKTGGGENNMKEWLQQQSAKEFGQTGAGEGETKQVDTPAGPQELTRAQELGIKYYEHLNDLLSGKGNEQSERFARDEFTRWLGDLRMQKATELTNAMSTGQLNAGSASAELDEWYQGAAREKAGLESNLSQQRKETQEFASTQINDWLSDEGNRDLANKYFGIAEKGQALDVARFGLDQKQVDNAVNVSQRQIDIAEQQNRAYLTTNELNNVLKAADLVPSEATNQGLITAFPAIRNLYNEDGSLKDEFTEDSAYQAAFDELVKAGVPEDDAKKWAAMSISGGYQMMELTINSSHIDIAAKMPDDKGAQYLVDEGIAENVEEATGIISSSTGAGDLQPASFNKSMQFGQNPDGSYRYVVDGEELTAQGVKDAMQTATTSMISASTFTSQKIFRTKIHEIAGLLHESGNLTDMSFEGEGQKGTKIVVNVTKDGNITYQIFNSAGGIDRTDTLNVSGLQKGE